MSLTIKPFETIIAIGATGLAIRKAGAGDATKTAAAATTALAVGQVFTTAATGDLNTALQELNEIITSPSSDPTVALVLQNLFAIAESLVSVQGAIISIQPLIGATIEGVLGNIGAGVTQVANAYLAQKS